MTTRTTPRQLPRPLGICPGCYADQAFHAADVGQDVYYCSHNGVMALPKHNGAWISESGIDRAEFDRRCESAAQDLQMFMARARKAH